MNINFKKCIYLENKIELIAIKRENYIIIIIIIIIIIFALMRFKL